jgi:ABC-type multidrug transport system ATPase subunit
VDTHFPHLRVNETLNFASETKTPRMRPEGQRRKDYVTSMTDMYVTGLGLRHTLQTKVGNDFVRGISGGERRRVSLAEMASIMLSQVVQGCLLITS